ncbi:MAG: DUF2628 domain-containing protein [Rhodocyclaceae bacterium]
MAEFLEPAGEFLEIDAPITGYVGFHVMRHVEHAINYDLSQCKTYDTGAVLARKPEFYRDKVAGIELFTIRENPSGIFVSEAFRQAVTASFKTALATLGHADKIKMNANIWAFFFGPIYLCLLGLWKKALVLTAVVGSGLVLVAVLNLPGFVQFGLGFASSVLFALSTNHAYYLKCIKGQDGWNAFEGLRW